MVELGEDQAEVVRKILSWLLVSQRPLNTSEMCKLVCAPEVPSMTNDTILDMCFDLVNLDEGQDQFRFSHLSVREFLEKRTNEFAQASMQSMATNACVTLMMGLKSVQPDDYAAYHWPLHAEYATKNGGESRIEQTLRTLFTTQIEDFVKWNNYILSTISASEYWERSPTENRLRDVVSHDANTIFVIASFGLIAHLHRTSSEAAEFTNLEAKNEDGYTALYLASELGHIRAVRTLLDRGADINAGNRGDGSALQAASRSGYLDVVQLLLESGADINAVNRYDGSALQAASRSGYLDIVQLLLDSGADINAVAEKSVLHAASGYGHLDIVQLLLKKGAKAEGDALVIASCLGHIEIVQLLLDHGVDINAKDRNGNGSALNASAESGEADCLKKLLLKKDVDMKCDDALYAASKNGHVDIVRQLVERGLDAETDALEVASYEGHADIVLLLLQKGVNIDARSNRGSALQAASFKGHFDIVQILLKRGANVNAEKGEYGNALHVASMSGSATVVQKLLEQGANVSSDTLCSATWRGHTDIVRQLLEKGADVNARGGYNGDCSALYIAAFNGHTEIVQQLLEKGADICTNIRFGNALYAASSEGHVEIVQQLLDKCADFNATGDKHSNSNALQAASEAGYVEIVRKLLEKGADVNTEVYEFSDTGVGEVSNALYAATKRRSDWDVRDSSEGNIDRWVPSEDDYANVIQQLLENGADVDKGRGYGLTVLFEGSE
ncbi:hypothetical protein AAFC00_005174 [Neodothiora populina]|uniref:Ankyrin repeat protein n=1 Tax=Neodothiora populina TaxID=2781224 RepID=A0ABR3PK13_9PEZI